MHKNIPFHGNPDDTKCGQSCYKMALEYFYPGKSLSFEEWDDLVGATPGKYTWPYAIIGNLPSLGLKPTLYDSIDHAELIADTESYLTRKFGKTAAQNYLKYTDLPALMEQTEKFLSLKESGNISLIQRSYTVQELKGLLDEGNLLVACVNMCRINNFEGYVGHYILVHDYDDKGFIAHDPGETKPDGKKAFQYENRSIPFDVFYQAACPSVINETAELIAMKL